MAKGHEFNFWGGDKLSVIGATWFVSYAYYNRIDSKHCNWGKVKTWKSRESVYFHTQEYHKFWLEQIANMNNDLLKTNKIGLDPIETKRMAKEILARTYEK